MILFQNLNDILLFCSPQDKYILRLVTAMEGIFFKEYDVSPSLVADVHQYLYKSTGTLL